MSHGTYELVVGTALLVAPFLLILVVEAAARTYDRRRQKALQAELEARDAAKAAE